MLNHPFCCQNHNFSWLNHHVCRWNHLILMHFGWQITWAVFKTLCCPWLVKNGIPILDSGGVTPYHHQTTGVDCSQRSFQQLKSPRFSRSMTISPAPDTRGHTGPCPAARCDPLAPASRRRSRPICRCPAATHGTLCARRRLGSCRGIWSFGWSFYLPIGSMVLVYLLTFGVYWYILMVNVTIYSIHGFYGLR